MFEEVSLFGNPFVFMICKDLNDISTSDISQGYFISICAFRCFPYLDDYYASQCLNIFLSVLKTRFPKTDDFLQCKVGG